MFSSCDSLPIVGHDNLPLPHSFIRQRQETSHLAVFFPGFAYGQDNPALYYPARLLSDLGADILRLERLYANFPGFQDLSESERARAVVADALSACETGLKQREYRRITFVGKSIGTLAVARLLTLMPQLRDADCIWLTPLLENERLRRSIVQNRPRSLFVVGTADHCYNPELLREVEAATGGRSVVIDGADHSLEVPASVTDSIKGMAHIVEEISVFLSEDRQHFFSSSAKA